MNKILVFMFSVAAILGMTAFIKVLIRFDKCNIGSDETFISKNVIVRILGNDIEGLHSKSQTYDNLKFTLENEPSFHNCDKIFLLNRIMDTDKKGQYIDLLNRYKIPYIDDPFSMSDFNKLPKVNVDASELKRSKGDASYRSRKLMRALYKHNLYIINNNGGRNSAIQYGKKHNYRWTFVFDSNQFFTADQYKNIVDNTRPDSRYIIIPQKRLGDLNFTNDDIIKGSDLSKLPSQEAQIAVRYDSAERFNEQLPYGASPKMEMLRRLVGGGGDSDGKLFYNIADRAPIIEKYQTLSEVYRLCSGNINNSPRNNYNARILGLYNIVNRLQ